MEGGPPPPEQDRVDDVLDTLACRNRRRVLYYLCEHGDATMRELADVLTGWAATDSPGHTATTDQRRPLEADLVHDVVPKLSTAGFVRYDAETDVVRLTSLPGWVLQLLGTTFEMEQAVGHPMAPRPDGNPGGGR
jgi:DNA-binding transcriptional ArsR family regulator